MTRSEKLDSILYVLLGIDKMELNNEPVNKKITIDFINGAIKELELVSWEIKSLKDELLNERLITENNGELRITHKGKKFITKEQGFKKIEKISEQEDTIREKTIEKFKYDKFSFWVSIIAIGIAGLSLLMTILKQ